MTDTTRMSQNLRDFKATTGNRTFVLVQMAHAEDVKERCFTVVQPGDTAASLLRLWDSWNHLQHSNTMINFMTNPTGMSQNLTQ